MHALPELLQITPPDQGQTVCLELPTSKSESNRALVINALSATPGVLRGLSAARDTQTMQRLLAQPHLPEWNVGDAGTTMRFLTAYAAVTGWHGRLTGTPRMCQRPIGLLVDRLRQLGAHLLYEDQAGYPPLRCAGFNYSGQAAFSIPGGVSSQFVSALLMIAPCLPQGLELTLTGQIGSRPYIEMTLALMRAAGAEVAWTAAATLRVKPRPYQSLRVTIEPDWSAASYWFSVVALHPGFRIELPALRDDSRQGDRRIVDLMRPLGVQAHFTAGGAELTAAPPTSTDRVAYDFTDCPDLAQTVLVAAAGRGVPLRVRGLASLRLKETDRIAALQTELARFGATLVADGDHWQLTPPAHWPTQPVRIRTYEDHRMAMAFAPLALRAPLVVEQPGVVAKSYPHFWEDLARAGFSLQPARATS